jgi:hypothetical protein
MNDWLTYYLGLDENELSLLRSMTDENTLKEDEQVYFREVIAKYRNGGLTLEKAEEMLTLWSDSHWDKENLF